MYNIFNPIQDGFFGAAHGWTGGRQDAALSKICHIYPAMMKFDTVILRSAFFHQKSANFAISRNVDIDCILMHNF